MKQLLSVLSLCMLLSACDRSSPNKLSQAISECISTKLSADERESMGARAELGEAGYPVRIARFDFLTCRGAAGLADNNQTMRAQGLALSEKLLPSREFRRGLQTTYWRQTGQNPAAAAELAGLVIQHGENIVTRAWARSCRILADENADVLRDLEAPYLTAYVGLRNWAPDISRAKALAASVAEQSKVNALFEATQASAACDSTVMKQRQDAHLAAMSQFVEGLNPAVSGCKSYPKDGELVLDCSASANATASSAAK